MPSSWRRVSLSLRGRSSAHSKHGREELRPAQSQAVQFRRSQVSLTDHRSGLILVAVPSLIERF